MPAAPQILPTQITEGTAPGLSYRLEGELVPVLHMALDGKVPVYFEHHVLLWKYPKLQIGLHPLKKGLKRRVFGGMPLLLLEAQSPGEIAFSRDAPGHIAALHLQGGKGIVVREHQFLAATGRRPVRLQPDQGLRQHALRRRLLRRRVLRRRPRGRGLGPRLRQRVREAAGAGRVDRHRARRLGVPRPLGADDARRCTASRPACSAAAPATSCSTASPGPGRVGLQSAYFHPPVQEGAGGNSQRKGGGLLGGIVGGLLDN